MYIRGDLTELAEAVPIDLNGLERLYFIFQYFTSVNRTFCIYIKYESVHEISNNVVCATSKAADQPAHMRSLIRAVASRLSIL